MLLSMRPVGVALTCLGFVACARGPQPPPQSPTWRAVWMSDTHVIGPQYTCCENDALDTTSIYRTRERLAYAVDAINALSPAPDKVFVAGDIFHNAYVYGGSDVSRYTSAPSAASEAATLLSALKPEVELAWGNHDYSVPGISREFSASLFDALFHKAPYYAVDHRGFRFLVMNSMLGETWNEDNAEAFNPSVGSFGDEQLDWAADQLDDGVPTFLVFHHHPLGGSLARDEREGPIGDVYDLVRTYADVVQGVFMGHLHRWVDTPLVEAVGLNGIDVGGVPFIILGSLRYDADNYWVMELNEQEGTWRLLDKDKADWGTTWAWGETWSPAGEATIDKTGEPSAYDPATQSSDLSDPVDPENPPTP